MSPSPRRKQASQGTSPPEARRTEAQPDPAERRAAALRAAAAARRADAAQRANAGLRQLVKDGAEINFRSVARAGNVGLNFLYDHPDLRRRIESLRAQQAAATRRRPPVPDASNSDSNVLRTLSAQLKAERASHRDRVRDLEARLAAAHEEILRLKRASTSRQSSE
jgi:hypothetical protein